jgi:VanZ family protein
MSKYYRWIPALVMMAGIFVLSSIQGPAIDAVGLGKESYHINGHFVLFLILCLFYYKALKNPYLSFVLTVLYGIIDEYHQKFTPYRSSSLFDIFIDTMGAGISFIILWKLQHILPKKLKKWLNN